MYRSFSLFSLSPADFDRKSPRKIIDSHRCAVDLRRRPINQSRDTQIIYDR